MIEKRENTWWVRIYTSGPLTTIEDVCRRECLNVGLCVTVEPTRFIYTGGEETGAVVGLIRYPRFPATREQINGTARNLAHKILEAAHQHSILIMNPEDTYWITQREPSE